MKKFSLVVILLLALQSVLAYDFDVIITKSRQQIQCVIIEQNSKTVTYKLVGGDGSQQYTISMSDVEKIYSRNIDYAREQRLKEQAEKAKADSLAAIKTAEEQERLAREKIIADSVAQKKAEEKLAESNKKFKEFSGTLKGSIDLPEEKKEQPKIEYKEDILLLVVTGLKEDQADIKQIIENELSSQFSLDAYKVQKYDTVLVDDADEAVVNIGRQAKASKICVIKSTPYQNEYYVQAKIINTELGRTDASVTEAASLSSLRDIIASTDAIAVKLKSQLSVSKEKQMKEAEDEEMRQFQAECDAQQRKREQERQRRIEEEEELARTQEALDDFYEQLQISGEQLRESITNLQAVENTYALDIVNTKNYPCKVIVAGCQVGIVQARTKQRFLLSTDVYGKAQLIQASGYMLYPTEINYTIPRQAKRATVTLKM